MMFKQSQLVTLTYSSFSSSLGLSQIHSKRKIPQNKEDDSMNRQHKQTKLTKKKLIALGKVVDFVIENNSRTLIKSKSRP
ncbi:CLUMA_CG019728, isoform A [Clunio marinus]|uniref:CLUMA_CG019728, isoform A n=1 Tax=Clunio marinus TaxID=568069 RepID=A0A1J1J7M3_9DIPT|nr:CLUMA_CG019728, isoform A [Clunio marinus]